MNGESYYEWTWLILASFLTFICFYHSYITQYVRQYKIRHRPPIFVRESPRVVTDRGWPQNAIRIIIEASDIAKCRQVSKFWNSVAASIRSEIQLIKPTRLRAEELKADRQDIQIILPTEIIELISLATDAKTKRLIRSTSKYWFKLVQIDEFTVYFARPKTIPAITQHFFQFYGDKAIGLSFKKIILTEKEEIPLQHFAKLTHLTSLNFEAAGGLIPVRFQNASVLANLSNLLSVPINCQHFSTNITALTSRSDSDQTKVQLYTNLRELNISSQSNPFVLVPNPTRLKALGVNVPILIEHESTVNLMTRFGNLKKMTLSVFSNPLLPRIFTHLTALEELTIHGGLAQDDVFSLPRLTYLSLRNLDFQPNPQSKLPALAQLKFLRIPHFSKDRHYSFLRLMTALEDLLVISVSSNTEDGLKYANSQKFTRLEVEGTSEKFMIDSLSNFTTLRVLGISEMIEQGKQKSYDGLTNLINLTKFEISTQTPSSVRFTVINSLTNLKQLKLASYTYYRTTAADRNLTLSNLTNLESLTLGFATTEAIFDSLATMTRLTLLSINLPQQVFDKNPAVLYNLTKLRKLTFKHPFHWGKQNWRYLLRLRDLEFLDVWCLIQEETIQSFSALEKLTYLAMRRSPVQGIHLTKLTGLQDLTLISKPARKLYDQGDALRNKLTRLSHIQFKK